MSEYVTSLERAFALARSGSVQRIADIRTTLRSEGFDATQLDGPVLKRQLRALIDKSHG